MQVEITPELLADLKEKAEKATQGLWQVFLPKQTDGYGTCIASEDGNILLSMRGKSGNARKYNSEYIAAANPAVMLALIARIEELEKQAQESMDK